MALVEDFPDSSNHFLFLALIFGMAAGCLLLLIFLLKDRFGKKR